VIGATTALFMGLLGLVNNDIKRVVAYSTLSQLGYMTVALGAGAYGAGIFHLMTHAFFKALLFLAAGSVIIAMHHEQDMRRMGGLRKYLPVTYWTALIGSLALIGFPGFSGSFPRTSSSRPCTPRRARRRLRLLVRPARRVRHRAVQLPAGVHDLPRQGADGRAHPRAPAREPRGWSRCRWSRWRFRRSPSAGSRSGRSCSATSSTAPSSIPRRAAGRARRGFPRPAPSCCTRSPRRPFTWLAAGVLTAWFLYLKRPDIPGMLQTRFARSTGCSRTSTTSTGSTRTSSPRAHAASARNLWKRGDERVIDGWLVNGSAAFVGALAGAVRHVQSGYLYHYAFAMIIGLSLLLADLG
jgi:NADH-quinone oxidoreductase subunit L